MLIARRLEPPQHAEEAVPSGDPEARQNRLRFHDHDP